MITATYTNELIWSCPTLYSGVQDNLISDDTTHTQSEHFLSFLLFVSFILDNPDAKWMALQFDVYHNFGLWYLFSLSCVGVFSVMIWIVPHIVCFDFETDNPWLSW